MPPILFEDKDILVINKPAGLVVHGDGKAEFETLSDIILKNFPELKDVGEPLIIDGKKIFRPGIVHRLDKDTSGCLLIAKNQSAFEYLKFQFQNHEIKKTYHACLFGIPKEIHATINEPIGRSRSDVRKWATGSNARGEMREAVTMYDVLAKIGREDGKGSTEEGTYSYVEARPKTGRTHQLRVHFKHINHPIVSDELYASKRESNLGFKRLALHARSIIFKDLAGKEISVEANFPEDFMVARSTFGLKG